MEVDSDSSSGSVIITGPIPEYPELRRRPLRTSVPAKKGQQNKRKELILDITQDIKVEKIQELEDLVKATRGSSGDRKYDDVDAWSGSDTKSIKGSGKVRDPASKYLKKIKTLQQNKRRQETRISKLTKEVRSLRDKVSVQAAYIDVLCGMLGDDMKEKFQDRQGMGILGNSKIEDEHLDGLGAFERGENEIWPAEDAEDKTTGGEGALKEKEGEFYCVEDLDEAEENGISRAESSEDLKEITEINNETRVDAVIARPLDVAGPSTSFGAIGNRITGKELSANELNALTIAVPMCDGKLGEIHHEVFGAPYEKQIRNYEGQVGESMFAPRVTKEINPYGEMRFQVVHVKPHMEPIPNMISYGIMGNGLNIFSAVPAADDPLNIGEDASSFGPLIINTSLDPLNLISQASTSDRMKISQANTSRDPLNIDGALIDDPNLPNDVHSMGDDQSSALHIPLPRFTAESDNRTSVNLTNLVPMETDAIPAPQPTSVNTDGESSHSTIIGKIQNEIPTNPTHSDDIHSHFSNAPGALSMPLISDAPLQDDDSGNISQPQAIVDHLINNISCDFSPDLRLD